MLIIIYTLIHKLILALIPRRLILIHVLLIKTLLLEGVYLTTVTNWPPIWPSTGTVCHQGPPRVHAHSSNNTYSIKVQTSLELFINAMLSYAVNWLKNIHH